MKTILPPIRLAVLGCLAAGLPSARPAQAQDFDQPDQSGWFLRADAAARFNIKAGIRSVPPPAGAGIYDDGFVQPDIAGPASPLTWNWGYNDPSQVDAANNRLAFHRLEAPAFGQQALNLGSPLLGGEIIGGYNFNEFQIAKKTARFGFEIGYGHLSASEGMSFANAGNASYTTFTYGDHGITPPAAPYSGTFAGPGPVIESNPNDPAPTPLTGTASDLFQGSLTASFHELRIGPALELDLSKRLSVAVGAGYSSVYVDAGLNYVENATYSPGLGVAPAHMAANIRTGQWRPGAYTEARLNCQLTRLIGVFLGGDLHYNKSLTFGDAGHEVKIDLGTTYGAKAGVIFRF